MEFQSSGLFQYVAGKTSILVQSRESKHMSRLLCHVTETTESLSCVRAYNMVDRFCMHFNRLADVTSRSIAVFEACYRFIKFVSAAAGFVVVVVTVLLSVLFVSSDEPPTPSQIGLALSAVSSVRICPNWGSTTQPLRTTH